MSKEEGLKAKYTVMKNTGKTEKVGMSQVDAVCIKMVEDCIVLEFNDPIARKGIIAWANAMREEGYHQVYRDVMDKLNLFTKEED